MELVDPEICKISVSSVLERNKKEYGKQYLYDDREDTCWNSDQGVPQFIKFALREKLESKISKILLKVQFQGGFCGKECQIELLKDQTDIAVLPFYPKDNNDYQEFELGLEETIIFDELIFRMKSTTDFYGRIIVYQLSIKAVSE